MKKLSSLVLAVLAILALSCCRPASKMAELSVGMTKQEVISTLGKPTSASYEDGKEQLVYGMTELPLDATIQRYVVVLVDGKVISYGRQELPD